MPNNENLLETVLRENVEAAHTYLRWQNKIPGTAQHRNTALIIIANELHNISNTLKSIDESLKNE